MEDDPDPAFRTYCHLFATRRPWRRGCIGELLRDIADDKVAGVLITDTRMQRIHHPYDGGADVFLTASEERGHPPRASGPTRTSVPDGSARLL